MTRPIGWRWWTAVIGTAVLLRTGVALGLLGAMPMVSDARDYFDLGVRLAAGDVGDAFYWPPGESLALAAVFAIFGPTLLVARVLTISFGVASVALTALIAREVGGERAGRAAGWIAAVYAPSILICGQTYAQHLAALCVAAVAYFGLRALREQRLIFFAIGGAALGVGWVTRPSMISVAALLFLAWAIRVLRRRTGRPKMIAGASLFAVVALGCVLPTAAHDARAGAGWTVSTNNERNLFLGNNPYTPNYKTSHLGQRSLDELPLATRTYLESFYERPDAREAMRREAVAYAAAHPIRTAQRTLNRVLSFWGFDYLGSRQIQEWHSAGTRFALPLIALEAGSYCVVTTFALVALFALPGVGDGGWRAWLVALALAYELPYAIAFSGGTYHFPVMPLVVSLGALVAAHTGRAWTCVRQSRTAWVAIGVFALAQVQYGYHALQMSG